MRLGKFELSAAGFAVLALLTTGLALVVATPRAGAGVEAAAVWTPPGACGSMQTTTVPANVTSMTVAIAGGRGGNAGSQSSGSSGSGSSGSQVSATFAVTAGQTISAVVGCAGANGANSSNQMLPGAAGWSSGGGAGHGQNTIFADGSQGGAGGGSRAVCIGSFCNALGPASVAAVAGGGGGGGVSNCAGTPGGNGGSAGTGSTTFASGGSGPSGANGQGGGNSGSSSGGGAAGPGGVNSAGARGPNGQSGTNSSGGVAVNVAGGGGGAGYEGGGAGGNSATGCKGAGGAGGGSSWVRSTATAVSFATNPGATGSVTVTFADPVDSVDPTATILTPQHQAVFDPNEIVIADYSCSDDLGGSGVASCVGTVPDGSPIDTSTLGGKSFTVTATDNAGNVDVATHTYSMVDGTDPQAIITTPAEGAEIVRTERVLADYECLDDEGSGVASCVGTVPDGSPIDTSTLGGKSFTVTATDNAGNVDVATHTYSVVDGTDPQAIITTPAEGAEIVRTERVLADYECLDEAGGSGIDSCVGDVARGAPIDTDTVGPKTFTVDATDVAGNTDQDVHDYTVVPIPAHGFSDVPAWVDEAVDWLAYYDHVSGYPGGLFRPDWSITRAQVANILWKIEGSPPPGAGCGGLTDVPAWAQDGICWLINEGHATGYPGGLFRPDWNITRAQVGNMLWGIADSPASGAGCGGLTDVPAWAQDGICWLVNQGHATGYPGGLFRPDWDITRAQFGNLVFGIYA